MADTRICSVEGCGKSVRSIGLCRHHYQRNRERPHIPLTAPNATTRARIDAWMEDALRLPTDKCIVWPFARDSKGYAVRSQTLGGSKFVHVQQCEKRHGPRPSPRHEAAHSCGKGHLGCINPDHVRWATRRENEQDKLLHGTKAIGERVGGARFCEADIRDIRQRWARGETQVSIAKLYGCRQNRISNIVNRGSWKHVQ